MAASSSTPVTIAPKRGMVATPALLGNSLDSFRSLVQCRLMQGGGGIEQTPPFLISGTYTAGTYYNGGALTESSSVCYGLYVKLASGSFQAGQYCARLGGTQLQVVKQSAVPTTATIYGNCLLVINSYAGLGLTLGLTLDVEIEAGGTTFKWRKNGGGYTLAQPCALTGTAIDGGNATVYFLAVAGFTAGDVWSWTRTDWMGDATTSATLQFDWSYDIYNEKIYFIDFSSRVMVYENDGCRSVGYRPAWGTNVCVFYEHLYVGNYSTAPVIGTTTGGVIGNSDRANVDCFWATDTNEADTYTVPAGVLDGDSRPTNQIVGIWKRNNLLYIQTSSAVWSNQYVGLPNVNDYNFTFIFGGRTGTSISNSAPKPVVTAAGAYLFGTDGIYFYDGNNLNRISDDLLGTLNNYPLGGGTFPNIATIFSGFIWGGYDNVRREVYFYSTTTVISSATKAGFWVYQERNNAWYNRIFTLSAGTPSTMSVSAGRLIIPIPLGEGFENSRYLEGFAHVLDAGTTYQIPSIETQDISFDVQTKLEINELFLDAFYAVDADPFATTGVVIDAAIREYAQSPISYTSAVVTWTTSDVTGQLSFRENSRIFRFRIRPTVTATKLPRQFVFNRLILNVLNLHKDQVRR